MKDHSTHTSDVFVTAPEFNNISFQSNSSNLTILYRWYSHGLIQLIFTFVWSVLWTLGFGVLSIKAISDGIPLFILFIIPAFIGPLIFYYVLAGFINQSKIDIDLNTIIIKHNPLPWPGIKRVAISEINRLYYVKKKGSNYDVYKLYVDITNHQRKKLLTLQSAKEAKFIKQKITSWLGDNGINLNEEKP